MFNDLFIIIMVRNLFLISNLILTMTVFGQSKKEEILKLNNSIDSIQNLLHQERNLLSSTKLELFKVYDSLKFQIQENQTKNEIINSNLLKIENLNKKNSILNDSLVLQIQLNRRLTEQRDFSNNLLNDKEIDFIITYFKRKLKVFENDFPGQIAFQEEDGIITVHSPGEIGYVPAFIFSKELKLSLFGDLDNDGIQEVIFEVEVTAGGTSVWKEIYCLKYITAERFLIFKLDFPCPCSEISYDSDCRDPNPSIIGNKKNIIEIESPCYKEIDPDCCPSIMKKARYIFEGTEIIIQR
jgi:hypothetical protein